MNLYDYYLNYFAMGMKKAIVFIILSLLIASSAFCSVIEPGEYLEYEVSYFGIKLGSIKLSTYNNGLINGSKTYRVKAQIDSYKGIPFVDLHSVMNSFIDESGDFTHKFTENKKVTDGLWNYQEILFNYKSNQHKNEIWEGKTLKQKNIFYSEKKWNDGLSLICIARAKCGLRQVLNIPTLVFSDTAFTVFYFYNKREGIEIDALSYPVRCLLFDGQAHWKGIYGLSGKFRGWFSDDEARIPIKAKMYVYVGNIVIELIKWKRASWMPPKYQG